MRTLPLLLLKWCRRPKMPSMVIHHSKQRQTIWLKTSDKLTIWFNSPRKQMWLHSFIVVTDLRFLLLLFSSITHSLLFFQTLVNKGRWSSARLLRVFLLIAFLISVPPCCLTSSSRPLSFVCALTTLLRALPLFRFHPHSHLMYFAAFCTPLRPL